MNRRSLSTPHIHKTLVPLMMVLSLLLPALTPNYSSAQEKDKTDKNNRKVVKKIKLKPTKDAEVIIPDFEATFYDDGMRSVGSTINGAVDVPAPSFDFEVDLANGTYKTTQVDLDEANLEERSTQDGQVGTLAVPGDYVWKVRIVGKDPVFIVVNETTNRLAWRAYSNGSVAWLSYIDRCYAPSPSEGNTNWFVTSCTKSAPYYPSGTVPRVRNWVDGHYINWDWENPNISTTVDHYISLTGFNDGTFTLDWDYHDAGEDYLYLRGTLYQCKCY